MRFALAVVLAWTVAAGTACGDSDGSTPDTDASVTPDAELLTLNAVRLRQELGGAMWANPVVYPQLPIEVTVYGVAAAVAVKVDGTTVAAEDPDNDNIWTAMVDITGLSEGVAHDVVATGTGLYGKVVTHEATLTVGQNGIRITDFAQHGAAATPRVNIVNRELWLTWVDARDGARKLWLQRMDGAGVPLAATETPICIVCAGDVVAGQVAAGDTSLGVLYQTPGTPVQNWFVLVDGEGTQIISPVALDPAGWNGATGGDIIFDGEHFIVVWRSEGGMGNSEVRWLRVHGATGETVGPVVVASAGTGSPDGAFVTDAPLHVAAAVDKTYVTFLRDRHDTLLNADVPRAQVAALDRNGTLLSVNVAGPVDAGWVDSDSHVFAYAGGAALVWAGQDTTAAQPTTIRGATIDATGALDPNRGAGEVMVNSTGDRGSPALVEHNVHPAVLAWVDDRGSNGARLYTAPLSASLNEGDELVFNHPRFVLGTSALHAKRAGTNMIMVWLDERNGGAGDPKPEVWLDTAWY